MVDNNKEIALDPQIGSLVTLAYLEYSTNLYSDQDISNMLNVEAQRLDLDLKFTADRVSDLLQNAFYCGKIKYKDDWYEGIHTPLISEELFLACQGVRSKRALRTRAYGCQVHIFPLRNLVSCIICGADTWCHSTGEYRYYQHPRSECSGSKKLIRAEIYEEQVDDLMKYTTLPVDLQRKIEALAADPDFHTRMKAHASLLQKQLDCLQMIEDPPSGRINEIECKLQAIVIPRNNFCIHKYLDSAGLGLLWSNSVAIEKRDMAMILFQKLRVDFCRKKIVEITIPACFEEWFCNYSGVINLLFDRDSICEQGKFFAMNNSKESPANSRDISSVVAMHSPLHRLEELLPIFTGIVERVKERENKEKEEVQDDNSE